MKLLLHACCAPCAIIPVEELRTENDITLYWYNPNIHPALEYIARRTSLDDYAAQVALPVLDERRYDMETFLAHADADPSKRCPECYRMRLDQVAARAAADGFEAFTSTLLYSPYQNRELMLRIGNEAAKKHGVHFVEGDWRERYREGANRSRDMGLYRQKYCGCVYSEKERYVKKLKGYVDTDAAT